MPMKLKSACLTPGCGAPVVYRGRCEEHAKMMRRQRAPSYGGDWEWTRDEYLQHHTRCEDTSPEAVETHRIYGDRAVDVHHVIGKARGGGSDWANLRAYCHRCHSRETRRRQLTGKE